jgi:hypothetical protein
MAVEGNGDCDWGGFPTGVLIHPFLIRGAIIGSKTIIYFSPIRVSDLTRSEVIGRYNLDKVC